MGGVGSESSVRGGSDDEGIHCRRKSRRRRGFEAGIDLPTERRDRRFRRQELANVFAVSGDETMTDVLVKRLN